MQRKGDFPLHRELVDGGAAGRGDPVLGDPLAPGLGLDFRGVWVEEDAQLRLVELLLVGDGSRLLDAIRIVEDDSEVPQPPDAGLRADRRLARLDARIAEQTLLGLAGLPVV